MRDEPAWPRPRMVGGRKIRIDITRPPTAGAPEERHRLREVFRAWVGARSEDRRFLPRHEARFIRLWFGWWRGDGEFFAVAARLVNVSRGGALVMLSDPPPERHAVWVCLGSPDPAECIEGHVLQVTTVSRRECALRVAFVDPCPPAFFEAAVCGLAPNAAPAAAPPRSLLEGGLRGIRRRER